MRAGTDGLPDAARWMEIWLERECGGRLGAARPDDQRARAFFSFFFFTGPTT